MLKRTWGENMTQNDNLCSIFLVFLSVNLVVNLDIYIFRTLSKSRLGSKINMRALE